MRPWFLITFVVVIAVAGCAERAPVSTPVPTVIEISMTGSQPASAATPLAAPSEVAPVPTPTSTPTPTMTSTASPTPTASSTPTRTNTPTVTHTPTRTHTPTPKPTSTPYPIPSGNITRIDATFHSASLGMDREVIIYLPPGYNTQSARRYPVLYILHGWGGFDLQHTTEWEGWGLMQGVQEAIVKGTARPMIVVQPLSFLPTGECSLYFNHGPGTDGKLWGDYIWKDVVNYIDSTYRTLPRRESRAIGGFSFGGQGALSLALTHPEVFKVVGGHSPSFRAADGSISYMNDPKWYDAFDPIWLVQNTDHAHQLSIWMDVATGDDKVRECGEGSDRCVEAFHALLASKGIPHAWQDQWPGPHEGTYWQGHLSDYLAWYSSQLVGE